MFTSFYFNFAPVGKLNARCTTVDCHGGFLLHVSHLYYLCGRGKKRLQRRRIHYGNTGWLIIYSRAFVYKQLLLSLFDLNLFEPNSPSINQLFQFKGMANIWQNILACDAVCNPLRAPNNPILSTHFYYLFAHNSRIFYSCLIAFHRDTVFTPQSSFVARSISQVIKQWGSFSKDLPAVTFDCVVWKIWDPQRSALLSQPFS